MLTKKPKRRPFIAKIRDKIVETCPGSHDATIKAIDRWSDGSAAVTPYEHGVFNVCDEIARQIDAMAELIDD